MYRTERHLLAKVNQAVVLGHELYQTNSLLIYHIALAASLDYRRHVLLLNNRLQEGCLFTILVNYLVALQKIAMSSFTGFRLRGF